MRVRSARRPMSLALGVVVAGLAFAAGVTGVSAQSGGDAPAPPAAEAGPPDAAQQLTSCLDDRHHVLVMFLIDQSGSLVRTDLEGRRIDAVRTALLGLDRLRSSYSSDNQPEIEVALTGFDVDFDTRNGGEEQPRWVPLEGDALQTLGAQAEEFRSEDQGHDTDYVAALQGADEALAERSSAITDAGQDPPCKVLIWFTDGEFDIEDRLSAEDQQTYGVTKPWAPDVRLDQPGAGDQLELLGLNQQICSPGGIADSLRSGDVIDVTVALATEIPPNREAVLQAIALGEGGGFRCGEQPAVGAYVSARDTAGLLRLFDRIGQPNGTPLDPGGPIIPCSGQPCDSGRYEFQVDPGISRFHVLALPGSDGVSVVLASPEVDEPLVIAPGDSGEDRLGSVELTHTWVAPDALVVDGELPEQDTGWSGAWSATFVDEQSVGATGPATVDVYVYGDLDANLSGDPVFRLGESSPFEFTVTRGSGHPADPTLYRSLEVSATVTDPATGEAEAVPVEGPDADGAYRGTYRLPPDATSSLVNLSLQVEAVTKSGLALRPLVRTTAVDVGPPLSYPQIEPSELHLSSVTGDGIARGELTVTGGRTPGCVWVESAEFDSVPEPVRDMALTTDPEASSRRQCLRVAPGQRKTIQIAVDPDRTASGTASGELRVRISSDASAQDIVTLDVPVSFSMFKPTDVTTALWVFLALFIPGVTLPFLIIWFFNWLGAKFEPPSLLRAACVPVRLGASGVPERTDGALDGLFSGGRDFHLFAEEREKVREFDATNREPKWSGSAVHFRGVAPPVWRPFDVPRGMASSEGHLVATGWDKAPVVGGRTAPVPLALPGTWLFVTTPEGLRLDRDPAAEGKAASPEGVEGRLIAFIEVGKSSAQRTDLERQIREHLATTVQDLRDREQALRRKDADRERLREEKRARKGSGSENPPVVQVKQPPGPGGASVTPPMDDWGVGGGVSGRSSGSGLTPTVAYDDWGSGREPAPPPSPPPTPPAVTGDDEDGWG